METGVLPWQGILLISTCAAISTADDFYCHWGGEPGSAIVKVTDPMPEEEKMCESTMNDPACLYVDYNNGNCYYGCLKKMNEDLFRNFTHGCKKLGEIMPGQGTQPTCICRKSHCDPRIDDDPNVTHDWGQSPRSPMNPVSDGESTMIMSKNRLLLILFTTAAMLTAT